MGLLTVDYLIIGDSAAGVSAAEQIRLCNQEGSILMVSKEPYPAYGRPLISYLLEGRINEENIWYKDLDFYMNKKIDTLRGPDFEVVSLDANAHMATLKNGDVITYGKALVATGSVPSKLPIKGLEVAENVLPFMTLDQAKNLLNEAKRITRNAHTNKTKSTALIIGAGLIGLKAAEALVNYVDEVKVVSRRWVLPAVLDLQGGQILQKMLARKGVMCLTGAAAKDVVFDKNRITAVVLNDGTSLSCDLVVSALGVRPNTELAVHAGAREEKGLICGTNLQTTLPDIFAAGDVTQVHNLLDGSKKTMPLWHNAVRQGVAAGSFMVDASEAMPFEGNFAVNATHFFDFSLLTCGITNPGRDMGYEEHIRAEEDKYTKFITKEDRLMGYILLNRPESAGIYTSIIEHQIPLSGFQKDLFSRIPSNLDFSSRDRWNRLHEGYSVEYDFDKECML